MANTLKIITEIECDLYVDFDFSIHLLPNQMNRVTFGKGVFMLEIKLGNTVVQTLDIVFNSNDEEKLLRTKISVPDSKESISPKDLVSLFGTDSYSVFCSRLNSFGFELIDISPESFEDDNYKKYYNCYCYISPDNLEEVGRKSIDLIKSNITAIVFYKIYYDGYNNDYAMYDPCYNTYLKNPDRGTSHSMIYVFYDHDEPGKFDEDFISFREKLGIPPDYPWIFSRKNSYIILFDGYVNISDSTIGFGDWTPEYGVAFPSTLNITEDLVSNIDLGTVRYRPVPLPCIKLYNSITDVNKYGHYYDKYLAIERSDGNSDNPAYLSREFLLKQTSLDAQIELGCLMAMNGEYDRAISYFEKIDSFDAHYNIAAIMSDKNNPQKYNHFDHEKHLDIDRNSKHCNNWDIDYVRRHLNSASKKILFFDTETTGVIDANVSPQKYSLLPRMVQIGWSVRYDDGCLVDKFENIIWCSEIPQAASNVHGITTAISQEKGIDYEIALSRFYNSVELCDMIVGHNVDFDIKIVLAETYRSFDHFHNLQYSEYIYSRYDYEYIDLYHNSEIKDSGRFNQYFENTFEKLDEVSSFKEHIHLMETLPRVCTMKKTVDFCHLPGTYGYKFPKLKELYKILFGYEFSNAHNATSDVDATAKCYFELVNRGII